MREALRCSKNVRNQVLMSDPIISFFKENFSISIDESTVGGSKELSMNLEYFSETQEAVGLRLGSEVEKMLSERKSARLLKPFSKSKLLSVLYHSARVKSTSLSETGFLKSHRPFASAGGRHPIELVILTTGISDLTDGFWYFDPYQLFLKKVELPKEYENEIRSRASLLLNEKTIPPAIILSLAILHRTLSRYKNGVGLIWRDTGNVFGLISFVVLAHSIRSCDLGFSEEFRFSQMLGIDSSVWITGALALGA